VKILHVLPNLAPGGMEQLAIQLAGDAADHGDRVVIASGPGAWVDKATAAGAEHFALPATSRSAIMSGRQRWPGSRYSPLAAKPPWCRRFTGSPQVTTVRRAGCSASPRAESLLVHQLSLARCRRPAFRATGLM
jgi:hypothetical protein